MAQLNVHRAHLLYRLSVHVRVRVQWGVLRGVLRGGRERETRECVYTNRTYVRTFIYVCGARLSVHTAHLNGQRILMRA